MEPYLGTETRKAELEPCVIPKPGSDCYKVIQWAMKDGVYRKFPVKKRSLKKNGWGEGWVKAICFGDQKTDTNSEKHGNVWIII